jgi:hypothetical protein
MGAGGTSTPSQRNVRASRCEEGCVAACLRLAVAIPDISDHGPSLSELLDFASVDFTSVDFTSPDFELLDLELPDLELPELLLLDFELLDFESVT